MGFVLSLYRGGGPARNVNAGATRRPHGLFRVLCLQQFFRGTHLPLTSHEQGTLVWFFREGRAPSNLVFCQSDGIFPWEERGDRIPRAAVLVAPLLLYRIYQEVFLPVCSGMI